MFGIGTTEFLVIMIVAVLVLGPEHLPRIMRTVTRVMSEIRKVSTDFQRTLNLEANQEDWRRQQAAVAAKAKKKKTPAPPRSSDSSSPGQDDFPLAPADSPSAPEVSSGESPTASAASAAPGAASGDSPADPAAAGTGAPPSQGERA
jgi:sec-independent protein translocase protein TatB